MLFDDVSEAIENGDEAALSGLFAEMDDEEARLFGALVSDSPEKKSLCRSPGAVGAVKTASPRGEVAAAKAQYDTVESLVGPIRDILFSGTQTRHIL